jgi:hypothetical protein
MWELAFRGSETRHEIERERGLDVLGLGFLETSNTRFRGSAINALAIYEAKNPAPTKTIFLGEESVANPRLRRAVVGMASALDVDPSMLLIDGE